MTSLLPKALCPVNNVPLVDLALARAKRVTDDVAVNIHHGREEMEEHLAGRAHLSIETPEALGTAGALGNLRGWIDGRDVLVVNSDAWHEDDLKGLLAGWDRSTIRLLTVHDPIRGDFGDRRYCGAALIPWDEVSRLEAIPSGLYETVWAPADGDGRLEKVDSEFPFFDCGIIADYHAANMAASGGANVIGPGAIVEGEIERTVLWAGVHVASGERLTDAIRPRDDITLFPMEAASDDR